MPETYRRLSVNVSRHATARNVTAQNAAIFLDHEGSLTFVTMGWNTPPTTPPSARAPKVEPPSAAREVTVRASRNWTRCSCMLASTVWTS